MKEHDFSIYRNVKFKEPISSDINIICSHGTSDIASKHILYSGEQTFGNLTSVFGNGMILIFFVCHSGSYKSEYFKNSVNSIVKDYLAEGYNAIIAPFWSLHVNIPQIWLPVFLNSLNNKNPVDVAVHEANKKVKLTYPTPVAWASMHLYGNPHLAIG